MDDREIAAGRNRGNISKIEAAKLQPTVQDLYAHGYGSHAISKELKKKGHDISPINIFRYFKVHKKLKQKILAERKDLQAKLVERQFDVHDKLISLAGLVEQKIEQYDNRPDEAQTLLGFIRELHSQLAHMNRLLGDLTPAPQVNISQTNILNPSNIAQTINNLLYEWFQEMQATYEDGKITFNKPTPKMIEDYINWKSKQPKIIEGEVVQNGADSGISS